MRIRVLAFAVARDILGNEEVVVDLNDDATLIELKAALGEEYPEAAEIVTRSAFALNQQYILDDRALEDGMQLALIPPVSGG